jgi:hypothetical protein
MELAGAGKNWKGGGSHAKNIREKTRKHLKKDGQGA